MSDEKITTVDALEAAIGKMSSAVDLKVIDHIDGGATEWIDACSLAFLGFSSDDGPLSTITGGDPGFIQAQRDTIEIPLSSIDSSESIVVGAGFGSLLILPKTGEMLRVNGTVSALSDDTISIRVAECYIHCAKALIRSDFWSPDTATAVSSDVVEAAMQSRFLSLVTMNEKNDVDVSPKGDPAGSMASIDHDTIWLADRPGNRRADSFNNILKEPRVSGLFFLPGHNHVQTFSGVAEPTTDAIREQFAVKDRVPSVVTRISISGLDSYESAAIARSRIWAREDPGINPAKILTGHVKLNKHRGLSARLVGTVASIPGFMRKNLDKSYETGLY